MALGSYTLFNISFRNKTFNQHLIAHTGYKNQKNLKNRFLPKSCVTVVFRPIPWFLAILRLRAMPKIYESTLFTLVDVSEKHRCIISCHSCAIHSCIIGVNKFVTQNQAISTIFLQLFGNFFDEYGLPDLNDGQKHQTDDIGW